MGECGLPLGSDCLPLVVGECDLSVEEGVLTSSGWCDLPWGGSAYL